MKKPTNHGACKCIHRGKLHDPFPSTQFAAIVPTLRSPPTTGPVDAARLRSSTVWLLSEVGSLCVNACVWCTSTRLSFLVTTYAPTVCSLPPLLLVKARSPLPSPTSAPPPPLHAVAASDKGAFIHRGLVYAVDCVD